MAETEKRGRVISTVRKTWVAVVVDAGKTGSSRSSALRGKGETCHVFGMR